MFLFLFFGIFLFQKIKRSWVFSVCLVFSFFAFSNHDALTQEGMLAIVRHFQETEKGKQNGQQTLEAGRSALPLQEPDERLWQRDQGRHGNNNKNWLD